MSKVSESLHARMSEEQQRLVHELIIGHSRANGGEITEAAVVGILKSVNALNTFGTKAEDVKQESNNSNVYATVTGPYGDIKFSANKDDPQKILMGFRGKVVGLMQDENNPIHMLPYPLLATIHNMLAK